MTNVERLLVVVTGQPGAGKTSLCNNLAVNLGFEVRNIGDELARIYRAENDLHPDATIGGLERMPIHKNIRKSDPEYFTQFCLEGNYNRRVIDGLRNLYDAQNIVSVGGFVVSLVADLPLRANRRKGDSLKDPDLDSLISRELAESNDADIDGAQTTAVMGLARDHGFYVNANLSPEEVLQETIVNFSKLGIEL